MTVRLRICGQAVHCPDPLPPRLVRELFYAAYIYMLNNKLQRMIYGESYRPPEQLR